MVGNGSEETEGGAASGSVVDRVLLSFIEAIEADDEVKDLAGRLRETLIDKHKLSEVALRAALFESDVI